MNLKKLIRSFTFAVQGLCDCWKEDNFKIECVAGVIAIALGVYFQLNPTEWILLTLTITLVLGAEVFNTAIERVVDLASPEIHPLAKKAKDAAAGAVLIFSLGSLVVAWLLFGTKIFSN